MTTTLNTYHQMLERSHMHAQRVLEAKAGELTDEQVVYHTAAAAAYLIHARRTLEAGE